MTSAVKFSNEHAPIPLLFGAVLVSVTSFLCHCALVKMNLGEVNVNSNANEGVHATIVSLMRNKTPTLLLTAPVPHLLEPVESSLQL